MAGRGFGVPDFNGALRVSALVFADDRYGSASAETLVRAPMVAEVSTPRVMALLFSTHAGVVVCAAAGAGPRPSSVAADMAPMVMAPVEIS